MLFSPVYCVVAFFVSNSFADFFFRVYHGGGLFIEVSRHTESAIKLTCKNVNGMTMQVTCICTQLIEQQKQEI